MVNDFITIFKLVLSIIALILSIQDIIKAIKEKRKLRNFEIFLDLIAAIITIITIFTPIYFEIPLLTIVWYLILKSSNIPNKSLSNSNSIGKYRLRNLISILSRLIAVEFFILFISYIPPFFAKLTNSTPILEISDVTNLLLLIVGYYILDAIQKVNNKTINHSIERDNSISQDSKKKVQISLDGVNNYNKILSLGGDMLEIPLISSLLIFGSIQKLTHKKTNDDLEFGEDRFFGNATKSDEYLLGSYFFVLGSTALNIVILEFTIFIGLEGTEFFDIQEILFPILTFLGYAIVCWVFVYYKITSQFLFWCSTLLLIGLYFILSWYFIDVIPLISFLESFFTFETPFISNLGYYFGLISQWGLFVLCVKNLFNNIQEFYQESKKLSIKSKI